jgi:hypothetical protein
MATSLTLSDIEVALREGYEDTGLDLLAKEHPLLGMIDSKTDFNEKKTRIPIKYGNPQGASPTFATAQTNAYAAKADAFELTRKNIYQVANIDGELIEQAAAGKGEEFLEEICGILDSSMVEVTKRIALSAYRSGGGAIGTVGSGTSSPITMANIEEVDALEIGMVIVANDTNDATTPRSGSGVITAINYDTGVVTYTGTITSLAVGDYIAIQGFQGAGADGLEGWCPESAPGATEFYGVDRSTNSRLGGTRMDCSTMTPEEVFARANARGARLVKKPDVWMVHPTDLANMEINLASQKTVVDSRSYDFGFEALMAYGAKVVPDSDCQRGVMWGVPLDHFGVKSLGALPKILNADGNNLLRAASSDAYEGRVGGRYNFWSDAPGLIMRVKLPT